MTPFADSIAEVRHFSINLLFWYLRFRVVKTARPIGACGLAITASDTSEAKEVKAKRQAKSKGRRGFHFLFSWVFNRADKIKILAIFFGFLFYYHSVLT